MYRRLNFFWLSAGAMLFVFGANEIAAYVLTRVPRWLGGVYSVFSGVSAVTVGLLVAVLLGVRPPVEDDAVSREAPTLASEELEGGADADETRPVDDRPSPDR